MSESIIMSIRPHWVKHIFIDKDKKFEVRKRAPKFVSPFKVYVYCTLAQPMININNINLNGLVCGEFTCTGIQTVEPPFGNKVEGTCLKATELWDYSSFEPVKFLEITNPILYDKPKELSEFGLMRPPQSWQFTSIQGE